MCQTEIVASQKKEAIHGRVAPDFHRQVEAGFSAARVDGGEALVLRRTLQRSEMIAFFAKLPATLIGLEACGSSHYWGRKLARLGHEVRLIPASHVKPYLKRLKNDARDAEAGCEALSRPGMRFVPVKTEADRAGLLLIGTRDRLIRTRLHRMLALR